jgi:hypothetical protein
MSEYEEAHRKAGMTMERGYVMPTPMGDFYLLYLETKGDFGQAMQDFVMSGDFARTAMGKFGEASGIDFTQPPPGPPPELVWNYVDSALTERKKGLAFCAPPLAPDKEAELRAFFDEATARRSELEESRRASGHTRDQAWLNQTPMGAVCCVYLEGDDPAGGNAIFAASKRPYDLWFKEQASAIFGIDFSQPLPPIEEVWDWSEAKVTA